MPHELERFSSGETALVAGHNLDAWHRLGTVLPAGLIAADAMTFAHMGGWTSNRGATLNQLFMEAATNGNIHGTTGPAARPSPSISPTSSESFLPTRNRSALTGPRVACDDLD